VCQSRLRALRCRGPLRRATERGAGRAPPILTRRLELQVGGRRGRLSAPPRRWRLGTRGACPRCGGPSRADARQRGPYPHGWASVQPARPRRVPSCSAPGEGVGLARDSPPPAARGHGWPTASPPAGRAQTRPKCARRVSSTDSKAIHRLADPRRTKVEPAGRWRCDRASVTLASCPMSDAPTARAGRLGSVGDRPRRAVPVPDRVPALRRRRSAASSWKRSTGYGRHALGMGKTPIALPAVGVFPFTGGSSVVTRS